MNAKTTIRKILFVTMWLCIGGGMFTLLLAAISKRNRGLCSNYTISIKATGQNLFMDEKDVEQLLLKAAGGKIKGQPVSSFALHQLEQSLEKNNWVSKAEVWFDNQDALHVTVTEKTPVARLFTTNGNSFYLDEQGKRLPLSDKMSARVPVFTNYTEAKKPTAKDSAFVKDIVNAASLILRDSFWMAQVAQVDITANGTFEMIPVVGGHIVRLGNGEEMDKKLRRLYIFYQQVLSKTGFDRYRLIDVQYNGQVVASRQYGDVKIDLAQHQRNVEQLIKESGQIPDIIQPLAVNGKYDLQTDSADLPDTELQKIENNKPAVQDNHASDPNPVKPIVNTPADNKKVIAPAGTSRSNPTENKKDMKKAAPGTERIKSKEKQKTPKAVMPKKEFDVLENGGYN